MLSWPSSLGAAAAWLTAISRLGAPWSGGDAVPLINLSSVDGRVLHRAATSGLGVFRLTGHNVDVEAVLNASRSFFQLPEDAKRSARSSSGAVGGFQRGYIPLGGESGLREFLELKEGFCYGMEPRQPAPVCNASAGDKAEADGPALLISPNAWPEEHEVLLGGKWVQTMLGFVDACIQVTDTLLEVLTPSTGTAEGELAGIAAGGEDISLMRLFHYFPNTTLPDLLPGVPRTGSSPHTDWHLVTVVLQDATGGLQVRSPRPPYEWVDVPAVDGELIIILGDYLGALSSGRVVSPVHRVLLPPSGRERFSLTYFRYPHYDAMVPVKAAARAQQRALRAAQRRGRRMSAGTDIFNTLVRPSDGIGRGASTGHGTGLEQLATRAFGELLLDKWRGVAANKAA